MLEKVRPLTWSVHMIGSTVVGVALLLFSHNSGHASGRPESVPEPSGLISAGVTRATGTLFSAMIRRVFGLKPMLNSPELAAV